MRLIHFIQLSNLQQIGKKELTLQMLKLALRMVYCQPICLLNLLTHINFQILILDCEKGIPYSQTLTLKKIYSDNRNFDKRCNELNSWLLEKGCSEKMERKQARGHSRESLLKKVKSESSQNKLTFNINYQLVFQNVRNSLHELHILLTPDKGHQKVFQNISIVGCRNGKSVKY